VTATIPNGGASAGLPFTHTFPITLSPGHTAATGIGGTNFAATGNAATAGLAIPMPTGAHVLPYPAASQTFSWSAANGQIITENGVSVFVPTGTNASLTATVVGGGAAPHLNQTFTFGFNVGAHVRVTAINENINRTMAVGGSQALTGTSAPNNATNRNIVWSVTGAGATIDNNNVLHTPNAGTVTVTATIIRGIGPIPNQANQNFTHTFTITVE